MRHIGVDARRYEVAAARTGLPERMEETLCAFANRDGGTIILGLDEADHFCPIADFKPEAVRQDLRRVAEELTPACRLEIKRCPFVKAGRAPLPLLRPRPLISARALSPERAVGPGRS